ncbi:MAG: DNA polymerase III subunit beta [Bacteroidota bacterium]|nr:DNA polymerase III subunit beta [Bacteroidota bacterium]
MKFIVSSSLLTKQLQVLSGIIKSNNALPVLDNFLFELDHKNLTLTASDLETTISAQIEIESEEKGSVAIPKRILDTLKTLPEQPLTFILEDNNTLHINYATGECDLPYTNGEEYPKTEVLENTSKTIVPAEVLGSAIGNTLFATANDDLRPAMNGVFFQFKTTGLVFVATDAHKLVKYSRTDIKAEQETEFIMPKKPLAILKGILDNSEAEVTVEYNESNAAFTINNYKLTCRLIDGKFPNYENVIPKENPNKLLINRNTFLSSVRRASAFSNKTTYQIRLKMAGTELNIYAEDPDYSGKAHERLSCDYQGDDLEIGFSSKFLSEMLNNLSSDEISLEMSMPNRAGILAPLDGLNEGENVLMLVMPVSLG